MNVIDDTRPETERKTERQDAYKQKLTGQPETNDRDRQAGTQTKKTDKRQKKRPMDKNRYVRDR